MGSLLSLSELAVTITGLVCLLLLVLKVSQKESSTAVVLLTKVNQVTIKIGAIAAVFYVLIVYYARSDGALTVESIGFYVAVGSILVSLLKGSGTQSEFLKNVGAVMASRAQEFQRKVADEAAKASAGTREAESNQDQTGESQAAK